MDQQRVTLITLGVADMAASRAFYACPGRAEHPSSQQSVAFFQTHGSVFGRYGRAALADDLGRPGADPS